jgi:hypothetical protein
LKLYERRIRFSAWNVSVSWNLCSFRDPKKQPASREPARNVLGQCTLKPRRRMMFEVSSRGQQPGSVPVLGRAVACRCRSVKQHLAKTFPNVSFQENSIRVLVGPLGPWTSEDMWQNDITSRNPKFRFLLNSHVESAPWSLDDNLPLLHGLYLSSFDGKISTRACNGAQARCQNPG